MTKVQEIAAVAVLEKILKNKEIFKATRPLADGLQQNDSLAVDALISQILSQELKTEIRFMPTGTRTVLFFGKKQIDIATPAEYLNEIKGI